MSKRIETSGVLVDQWLDRQGSGFLIRPIGVRIPADSPILVFKLRLYPKWQRECVESAFSGRSIRPRRTSSIERIRGDASAYAGKSLPRTLIRGVGTGFPKRICATVIAAHDAPLRIW
jgi:hypothetical protein